VVPTISAATHGVIIDGPTVSSRPPLRLELATDIDKCCRKCQQSQRSIYHQRRFLRRCVI